MAHGEAVHPLGVGDAAGGGQDELAGQAGPLACTPEMPIGTCMVSPEGACAAYYNFGRFTRERVKEATRT